MSRVPTAGRILVAKRKSLLQPPPGASCWLRADKNLALGAVTLWPDLSGKVNSFVTLNGSPTCTAGAGPGGVLPGVVFTGTQRMGAVAAVIPSINFTWSIVAQPTGASQILAGCGSGSGWVMSLDATSVRNFNANGVVVVSDGPGTTAYEAWIFSCDALGNLSLWVNGAAKALAPSTVNNALAPVATAGRRTWIGSLSNFTQRFTGAIFEFVSYPTALPPGQLSSLLSYQAAYSGLYVY